MYIRNAKVCAHVVSPYLKSVNLLAANKLVHLFQVPLLAAVCCYGRCNNWLLATGVFVGQVCACAREQPSPCLLPARGARLSCLSTLISPLITVSP